jgi:hypothetical protein
MGKNLNFEKLSQPSNVVFYIVHSKEKEILHALKLGHNVKIVQPPRSSVKFHSSDIESSLVQGLAQLDLFPLDRNKF